MAGPRKTKISNVFVWIILGLLIIGLAGFGATNFGSSQQSVAGVGSSEIDANRYARALDGELRAYSEQLGRNLTLEEARSFGIDAALLQRLLRSAAIEEETRMAGLSVGDAVLAQDLRTNRAFQGIDGNFDQTAYEFALSRAGTNVKQFEADLRAEIAGNLVQSAVYGNAQMPQSYAQALVGFLGERRSFSWIAVTEADLQGGRAEPSEADLQTFYDDHTDDFMLPLTKNITYAWLSPDMVIDDVQVSDEELQAVYDERADMYNQPERRLVERLVFSSQDAAQKAADDIAGGAVDFETLVTDRGLALEDVDMGDVTIDDLGPAAETVFAAQSTGIAGPVETDLGPALFRINAILAARVTPLEDVADELRLELAGDNARRSIDDRISEFEDLLAEGATIEELAAEKGMQTGTLGWFTGMTDGLAAYETFAEAASVATTEDFPEILLLEDGGVFALRVDDVVDEMPEPFDSARDRVADAWSAEALQTELSDLATELSARLDGGERLSALGFITANETRMPRQGFIAEAPAELVSAVFDTDAGLHVTVEGDGQIIIALVNDVHMADPDDPDLARISQAITQDSAQALADDLLIAFTRAVQNEAGISINQVTLNAIHAQFP
jgi:peptidyl-prolyl cis-trans isomerase D